MAKKTITLVLDGKVTLPLFAQAVEGLHALVLALQEEEKASAGGVDWEIDSLEAGSALATFRGTEVVDGCGYLIGKTVERFEETARVVQSGDYERLAPKVRASVRKIVGVLNGKVTGVRFETETFEASVTHSSDQNKTLHLVSKPITMRQGSVRGRVQSLSNRGQLRFTLYDVGRDRAVSCYLSPGSEDVMRDAWGRLARVEGLVSRDPENGQPLSVRRVKRVEIIHEGQRGQWKEAIRSLPSNPKDMRTPEQIIRESRDE